MLVNRLCSDETPEVTFLPWNAGERVLTCACSVLLQYLSRSHTSAAAENRPVLNRAQSAASVVHASSLQADDAQRGQRRTLDPPEGQAEPGTGVQGSQLTGQRSTLAQQEVQAEAGAAADSGASPSRNASAQNDNLSFETPRVAMSRHDLCVKLRAASAQVQRQVVVGAACITLLRFGMDIGAYNAIESSEETSRQPRSVTRTRRFVHARSASAAGVIRREWE